MINVDWVNLRTWDGTQNRAFELLCGQLAAAEKVLPESVFIPKAAPDAGIECYWRLPNEDEWAWQAKFFRDSPGKTQWKQMDDSIKTALAKHPRLTRYTFCLPRDREDPKIPKQQWFMDKWNTHVEEWAKLAQAQGKKIDFFYWGESEILSRLSMDIHAGRLYFWFNREFLHEKWFQHHIEIVKSNAGPRYSPELNVNLPIAHIFDGLGRVPSFVSQRLKSLGRQLSRQWQKVNHQEWREYAPDDFLTLETISQQLVTMISKLDDMGIFQLPLIKIHELVTKALQVSSKCIHQLSNASQSAQDEEKKKPESTPRNGISKSENLRSGTYHLSILDNVFDSLLEFIDSDEAKLANIPVLLLTGEAGTGKTHLLCDVADQRIRNNLPTVVLLGEQFSDDEPWTQIIKLSGLSCSCKEEFLGALEAAGQCAGSRALIFIDALNEGEGKSLWHKHLAGMLTTLVNYPWVGIALSIRTSYEQIIVPSQLKSGNHLVHCIHQGFLDVEYDATHKFFEYYEIQSPTVPFLSPEFRNPQFLKLFCEGIHRRGLKTIPAGLEGITSIFDFFLTSTEEQLWKPEKLNYDKNDRLLLKAVDGIVRHLAETGLTWLSRDEAKKIVDQLLPGRGYENSLFHHMLSEGIIATDMYYVGRDKPAIEVVHFAYERLTDHLVVKYLLDKNLDLKNPSDAFLNGKLLNALLNDEQSTWKNRGLIEALSIQVPERIGKELIELAPFCANFHAVQEAFIQSLIWRKPSTILKGAIAYINSHILKTQDGYDQMMNMLLTVAPRTDHPLNAKFLHNNLKDKSLPQRDSSWSIFLQYNYGSIGIIRRLIDWGWFAKDKQYASDESVHLTSLTLAWFLTSSNRFIRDRATKSLVSLLEKRLNVLIDILRELSDVNDPYVTERIYGVAYGCSLRSTNIESICQLGQFVYDFVFEKGTPPPNILLRDYAKGVVDVAIQRGCKLKIDQDKIRPPYLSEWSDDIPAEDELRDKYYPKDHSPTPSYISIWWSVMSDGDFARYIIGTNSSNFNWSNRRLDAQYPPTRKEQYEKYLSSLTDGQKKALNTYQTARSNIPFSIIIDEKGDRKIIEKQYSEKESETRKKKALDGLISSLGKEKQEKLKTMVFPYLENPQDETAFDLSIAQRWIFKKVIDLGWTPELFGEFEKYLNYHDVRESHKSERIGKKYQWIAYHEFLARVSDNFQWSGHYDGGVKYEGPWQFWGRDIDPSFLLPSTGYRPYEESPSWWFYPKYEAWDHYKNDLDWLKSCDDLPIYQSLMESSNPRDDSKWLLLDGSFAWEQPVPIGEDKYENNRKEIWYMFKSYFVKKEDVDEVYSWMTKQNFMGRWMPESINIHKMFLGEYPWAGSVPSEGIEEWTQGRESKIPKPILVSTSRYVWEGSGYDCSLEDTVSIQLPCKWLMGKMGLSWNGEEGHFHDKEMGLVAIDPSVYEKGPTVLLVNKELLRGFLDKNGYEILWTILGEKQILGPSTNQGEWKGYLELSGATRIRDGQFDMKVNHFFKAPEK